MGRESAQRGQSSRRIYGVKPQFEERGLLTARSSEYARNGDTGDKKNVESIF